jgi:adenine-specific DNA-methyltransferase
VNTDRVTFETVNELSKSGRPTLLFSPNGRPLHDFPDTVRTYLKQGEQAGLPARPLIASRKPWYKMERRQIPPFLFAYLGRRNARFVRNDAGVTPLTGFLCVYPNNSEPDYVEKLWRVLSEPETVANLSLVGKSYGSGCIKVEPRALERLPIPCSIINRHGLNHSPTELPLDWGSPAEVNQAVLVREAKAKYLAKPTRKPLPAGTTRRK